MTGQYILRHSLGFALQVLPAVSLMLLSFDRGCFRIRASRLWGLVMGLALLLSAAFPAAQFATGSYDLSAAGVGMLEGSRFANLYMCASIALLLLPFIFLVREPALRKLVAFSFALVYGGLQYSLANLLIPYLPLPDGAEVFPPQTFAAFAIVTAVTFPPIALYFRREVRRYLRDMTLRYSVREFVFLLVITVFYLVLNAAFGSLWASLREQLQLNPAYYPILFLLLTAMLCTVYFATIRLAILRQEGMEHALDLYDPAVTAELERSFGKATIRSTRPCEPSGRVCTTSANCWACCRPTSKAIPGSRCSSTWTKSPSGCMSPTSASAPTVA